MSASNLYLRLVKRLPGMKVFTHVNTSNTYKSNGDRECARRREQQKRKMSKPMPHLLAL